MGRCAGVPSIHLTPGEAAHPLGTDRRALDREAHAIRAELRRSGYRDRFELETRWAVEPLDLLRELRELAPTVVHFSGHGGHGVVTASDDHTARSGRPRSTTHRAMNGPRWPRAAHSSSTTAHMTDALLRRSE
jgi:hypothetical protein